MSFNYSSINNVGVSSDDPLFWRLPTPADCTTVRIIGIFLCLAAYTGLMLNGSLFASFVRHKALRTPPNIFIMFMSGVGIFACCTNMPLSGSSSIFCYWLYGRTGCQIEGLAAFLYGTASSYLLCTVSLSRCYIVVRPFNAKDVTVMKCIIVSCAAVLVSLMWTILPLVGWNEYTLEGTRTSCCTNLHDRRRLYISFNIAIFVFVYCLPLVILFTTNSIIYLGLKRMRDKIAHGAKAELSQKRIDMERRILKSIVITVFGFIFTWTPYAIVFFISAFSGSNYTIPPMATFMCACFAKTSVVWIPLLYMTTSTQFRFNLVDMTALDRMPATASVAGEASKAAAAVR
ncbi:unnamed protein product [Rotaria magnacalcarata]|uniref:G-protein coupled receptors family 1 profile domain-containing protein n=1 Tax=Rotaria magnacalcarata TaxID=392030 RepID=A0A816VJ08_9BILA|nr:unnamed protein product [Rotaria magnacalcarata]CAF1464978.1 unnamed protein product [Rotaria magnacalcarata]CAF2084155.1 unnamed protein product [Rotaria magnacalcarata]CAF2121593.1 unnamed protein product [Rotaria magnacalcarata]CAF2231928.1 unnamed protein product [Rotaria magnacalcarata]